MKRLAVYLKGYETQSVLAPLFKLIEVVFDLIVPLVIARIINEGIANADTGFIFRQFCFLLGLAAIGLACSLCAQYFSAKASVGFASRVRQALFDHIQTLSYSELDAVGTNTLITRLTSDINQIQTGLNLTLRLLLRSPFIVFGAMAMAFTINVRCALIFLAAIPVLGAVVFGIMFVTIPLFKKVQASLDKVLGKTRDNLTGVRVIRAFRREDDEVRAFDEANRAYTGTSLKVGRISALMNPLTYALINIATVLLIRQGALEVHLGNIAQGDVVALYNYMAQIIVELIKLANLIITIDKSLACASRVSAILDIEPGLSYPETTAKIPAEEKGLVEFDHVSFRYSGSPDDAIADVSFRAEPGSVIGIIGGIGSGKSTVVNLIPRFYDASEGNVFVGGRNVRDYEKGGLSGIIGVVPQKAVLFAGTVRDNMKIGNEDADDEEIWEALEIAQAKEIVENKENHLDFRIEQNGRNLSGGQRQRLTIARALVRHPEILILDDSASALDFATDARLRKALRTLHGKVTVFIVSQRTSSIRHADQILVMDDGKLADTGTHEELMRSSEIYQEIYYSQFPEERPAKTLQEAAA